LVEKLEVTFDVVENVGQYGDASFKDNLGIWLDAYTDGDDHRLKAFKECQQASVVVAELFPLFV